MRHQMNKVKVCIINTQHLIYSQDDVLITSDSWGDPLALLGIQSVVNDGSVLELCGSSVGVGPGQGVLPPVLLHWKWDLAFNRLRVINLIHTILEVLPGVSSSAFFSSLSSLDDLIGVDHTVLQFQSLNQVTVPDHASVRHLQVGHVLPQGVHLLNTLPHDRPGTEDCSMVLHGLLHLQPDGRGVDVSVSKPQLVNVSHRSLTSIGRQFSNGGSGMGISCNSLSASTAEDNQIEKTVSPKSVCSVHRAATNLTSSIQTGNYLVLAFCIDGENLSTVVGGDATHVVVNGGDNGDWLSSDIDSGKDHSSLGDTGKSGLQLLWGKIVELKVAVILLRATTSTLPDLHGHTSAHHVSAGQVLGHRGVPLHEPFALTIDKVSSLSPAPFCHQTPSAIDTSRMELHELHVLVGQASPAGHGCAIPSAGVGRCCGEERFSSSTLCHDCVL